MIQASLLPLLLIWATRKTRSQPWTYPERSHGHLLFCFSSSEDVRGAVQGSQALRERL